MSAPMLDKLFAAMRSTKGIPALENAVKSVLSALHDEKKGHRDVAIHIIEDFSLTQKVLKLANSAMYAPFANGTSSVTSALNMLGADALLHVVLSTAMVTAAEMENEHGLAKTLLASELARNVCADQTEDVSIAALMYELGSLMTARYLPDESATIAKKIASGMEPDVAATDVMGMTLPQVGAEVAKRWRLPTAIVSIIDGSGDPTLVGVAKFSNTVSALILQGKEQEVNQLVSEFKLAGVDTSRLATLIARKLQDVAAAAQENSTHPNSKQTVLSDLLSALTEARFKTAEELAAAMFAELSQTLKTAHCLLFMLTRSGDFGVRYGYGKGVDELKSKLRLSAEFKPTAFHAVIKNNVDVSIADVSKLKASALPDGYTGLLPHVNKFIVLPIANSRVCGLMYCDWDSDDLINQEELAVVKKLRQLFLPFFPR